MYLKKNIDNISHSHGAFIPGGLSQLLNGGNYDETITLTSKSGKNGVPTWLCSYLALLP